MRRKVYWLALAASVWFIASAAAQRPVGLAYYDIHCLYDTIPSPFYDDTAHTPSGRYGWNTARYRERVQRLAAVVDSMAQPLVVLWGVENEAVVRDLVAATEHPYTYLHEPMDNPDGRDFALLYYGDLFRPYMRRAGYDYLYVEGVLHAPEAEGDFGRRPVWRDTVGLICVHRAEATEGLLSALREERRGVALIVVGRTTKRSREICRRAGLRDLHEKAAQSGFGNLRHGSMWLLRDRISVDTLLGDRDGGVYIRRELLGRDGFPKPAYDKTSYVGGASYALPVFGYLE